MARQKYFYQYRRVYGHLWRTYGQSWAVRLSFVLQTLKNASKFIALPIALSRIITSLSVGDYDQAMNWAVVFLGFSALLGVIAPLVKFVGMRGEEPIYTRMTADYFAKLTGADMEYFNSNMSGYLTTATRQYVDETLRLVRSLRDAYLQNLLSVVLPIAVIAWVNVWLGCVAVLIFVVQAGYMVWASQRLGPYRTATRELYRRNSGMISDIISNILTVKAAAQEASRTEQVAENVHKEAILFRQRYTKQAQLIAGREVVVVAVYFLFLWCVVSMASRGMIDLGGAVLAITYLTTILSGAYLLAEHLDEHDDYIDRIIPAFEILERVNTVQDPVEPKALEQVKGAITFENVTFAYDSDSHNSLVLKDFTLEVPAGQKLGIVGISGAGKSTLTKLLLRFVDVDRGRVLVDGVDVRDVRQADLRAQMAYVPQEPFLFHSTIRENVMAVQPQATGEEVERALRLAHAWSFVEKLPHGVDSIVGERGVKLSGGQKQRVAVARAVLQRAPVMILDEATSALDSESEQIIKESFKEVLRGKTALVVAHRLSTLSGMDRIIVIDQGRIVEDGTHEQLLEAQGAYAHMWHRQQMHTGTS